MRRLGDPGRQRHRSLRQGESESVDSAVATRCCAISGPAGPARDRGGLLRKGLETHRPRPAATEAELRACGTAASPGFEHRATAATQMNATSSRSHCLFIIKMHQKAVAAGFPLRDRGFHGEDEQNAGNNNFSKMNLVESA